MTKDSRKDDVTPDRLLKDLWMARGALALAAAVELDLFSHIAEGNQTASEIAQAAGTSERGTTPMLDALVSLDYLKKKDGQYKLTPISKKFLVRASRAYMGPIVEESKLVWPGWLRLSEVVKTGSPVTSVDQEATGRDFFPKLVESIFPMSYASASGALQSLSKKQRAGIHRILDVAAGSAAWSLPFATALGDVRVTVVDFPEVAAIARKFAERFGVAERYDYIEANLREADFGTDQYDLVILGHIIHTEGATRGKKLIEKSYAALKDGGMLLIGEMIPNDKRTGPPLALLFGLNMLLHTQDGGVFTMKEYQDWMGEAGFKKVKTIDAPGPSPLILATK
jgi:ubiquinone/menaquinone biosynthesis C-methylase UbiE